MKRWAIAIIIAVPCFKRGAEKEKSQVLLSAVAVPVGFDFSCCARITMKSDMMSVHQYSLSGGKKDILREVVMKYIDHFYPK